MDVTKTTLLAMQQMAEDPVKCAALVKDDTCLGGLVIVLSNPDEEVVCLALKTLLRICHWSEHRQHLSKFLGMKEQLNTLIIRSSNTTKTLASQVLSSINHVTCQPSQHATASTRDNMTSTMHDKITAHDSMTASTHDKTTETTHDKSRLDHSGLAPLPHHTHNVNTTKFDATSKKRGQKVGRRNSMQVRGGISKVGKSVVLQIRGLDDKEDMELCRNQLLQVRGVISITFDMKQKRSILRTRNDLKPELLAQAIARTYTMMAQQVVTDEQGNDLYLSFGAKPEEVNKENEEMPDYPDDISPVRGSCNVARVGGTRGEDGKGWGFVKTVGDFLSTSFYW